jgi:hypothetical protein
MNRKIFASILTLLFIGSLATGCSRELLGGAAVGAAGAGAAYEYQHKKQMDRLEEDFEAGRIDREEYIKRKNQIEEGSLIY